MKYFELSSEDDAKLNIRQQQMFEMKLAATTVRTFVVKHIGSVDDQLTKTWRTLSDVKQKCNADLDRISMTSEQRLVSMMINITLTSHTLNNG